MGTSDPATLRAMSMQRLIDSKLTAILEAMPEPPPTEPQPEYFI